MRTFQLDECTNSKKLRWRCKAQGVVDVRSYPKDLTNKAIKDPAMLRWFAGLTTPLVTTDALLTTRHTADIPDNHAGIVVLCSADRHTLRLRDIEALLGGLKDNLPGWDCIDISNVIVELWKGSEHDVCVTRITSGGIVSEEYMSYEDADWPDRFIRAVSPRQFPRN